jgi:hypothetical protein
MFMEYRRELGEGRGEWRLFSESLGEGRSFTGRRIRA